jgi:hypothetical protein
MALYPICLNISATHSILKNRIMFANIFNWRRFIYFYKKTMLNTNLTQALKDEFVRVSGNKLSPDNNPAEFAVFLYEKLLSGVTEAVKEELTKSPEGKPYMDKFQKNLEHKLGSSFQ